MRVFISEYVCGGAWPEQTLDSSLVVEGRAMLLTLLHDFLRIPHVSVVTTWDPRSGAFPAELSESLVTVPISSPADEARQFRRLCDECDAAIVIAPEFHGVLEARVETASALTRLIGCNSPATRLCGDKLSLASFLERSGIPTVFTERFELQSADVSSCDVLSPFPCMIKPQDGAGSTLTFRVDSPSELERVTQQLLIDDDGFEFVKQPFVDGLSVSCAAIVSAGQGGSVEKCRIDVLPPCQQILSADGRFSYDGADFPCGLDPSACDRVIDLVHRCCEAIPGIGGYVGFDVLVPHATDSEPLVVDINPRLTTGYLLWRKMCNDNLAARLLGDCVTSVTQTGTTLSPLAWCFDARAFRLTSLTG